MLINMWREVFEYLDKVAEGQSQRWSVVAAKHLGKGILLFAMWKYSGALLSFLSMLIVYITLLPRTSLIDTFCAVSCSL